MVTILERDSIGRIATVRIVEGILNRYKYDDIGRVTSTKDAADYETRFQYNKIDTLTQIHSVADRTTQRQFGTCPRMLKKKRYQVIEIISIGTMPKNGLSR